MREERQVERKRARDSRKDAGETCEVGWEMRQARRCR